MKKTLSIVLFSMCATLILEAETETPKGRGEHTYDDIQGMWYVEFNMNWPENYGDTHSHYYIFKEDKMLTFDAEDPDDFHIYRFGFTNKDWEIEVDSIYSRGSNLVYLDSRSSYWLSSCYLIPKKELTIFYDECYYCEDIAEYAYVLKILFYKSRENFTDYCKQFLNCEIALSTDTCSLYDENKNDILKNIVAERAMVVVQNLGEWVKVRYCAPYEWKSITGYIRRENLQFVVEKEDATSD